ncbi:MAG TPA: sialidase family protein [Gaiellaceae bacterium]|nr:sialidase family protein [Gaiellaceae bacterium]
MRHLIALLALVVLGIAGALLASAAPARATQPDPLGEFQERLLSGDAFTALANPNAPTPPPKGRKPHGPQGSCAQKLGPNVQVNQNCLNLSDPSLQGRGQAQNETALAIDPMSPNRMVASYNDYRRGDGTCGSSLSTDGGKSWTDSTVPNGFTDGAPFGKAREYWQGGGDTSVAFDTKGNAYMACQLFNRGGSVSLNTDLSSSFYVFRSTGTGGASWNFVGRPVIVSPDPGSGTSPFEDKEYLAVDANAGSPFQDRVYVTWTEFTPNGTAYIYASHSSDYGEHFSAPVLVSTTSPTLCDQTYGLPTPNGDCNENQFSDPFVGPDGTLYVAYANFNTAVTGDENFNRILLTKSTDGGQTFSPPTLVGNYYDLPDCATYQGGQDAGRGCVPEKGSSQLSVFRATNYPSGSVDPTNPSRVVVTYGSYINRDSKEPDCVPAGFAGTGINAYDGVKTAGGCNNKILVSVSNNAGAGFTGGVTDPRLMPVATSAPGQAETDQWWQWAAFARNGAFVTSYYDRQYGNDETSGNMDFSLSSSKDLSAFKVKRVTSASMPPPTEFTDAEGNGTFFGDYTGLAVRDQAFPIWMDTRQVDLFLCPGGGAPQVCSGTEPSGLQANDQEIFTSSIPTG